MNVAFCTLGCKVNQAETRELKKQFLEFGYTPVASLEKADVAVFNSCTVTHIAERKLRNYVRRVEKSNPAAKIYICGCYANLRAKELSEIFPQAIVIGKEKKLDIKKWGIKTAALARAELELDQERVRQFLKIEDGCDQFCAYCVIPYARGPVVSYSPATILAQADALVARGARELIVTGINTGKYNWQGYDLADLLGDLEKISELKRIRVSSVEPNYVTEKLLKTLSGSPKFCHHLHIPIQSGSDRILKLMGRPYDLRKYFQLIELVRKTIPGLGLTTDLILGFPGETRETFKETLQTLQELKFSDIHLFKYSSRPGTRAEKLEQSLTPPEVQKMLEEAQALNNKYKKEFAKSFIGKPVEVLVHEKKQKIYNGLNPEYIPCVLTEEVKVGELVVVRPKSLNTELELVV